MSARIVAAFLLVLLVVAAHIFSGHPEGGPRTPLFVSRQLKPVWLDEAEIQAHLEREYRPGEEVER